MKSLQNTLKTWISYLSFKRDKDSVYIKRGLIYIEDFLYYDIYTKEHLTIAKDVLARINDKQLRKDFYAKYKRFFID